MTGPIDALATNGRPIRIRPVTAPDTGALHALIDNASDHSIYLRFFRLDRAGAHEFVERVIERTMAGGSRALAAIADRHVVALAGFEPIDARSAEVALLIDDAHQHLGIGTLLFEHLASLARQDGIDEFVAAVLLENASMIRVLRDSGFEFTYAVDHGEGEFRCRLKANVTAQVAVDRRERQADAASLRPLLAPRSVAVVGASDRIGSVGRTLVGTIRDAGFAGPIYPVNPRCAEVTGLRAYPSVRALPSPVDLAVVAVPAAKVVDVVRDCGEASVTGIVLISSGFRETSAEGADRERLVLSLVREYGMRLIGPNCLGIVNTDPDVRLDATIVPLPMRRGGLGLASQSGALGIAVAAAADRFGVGISQFVSLGNKADVSGNDLLMYWADDPTTSVIALYLESFGNARKFARVAREVSRTKPILAIKSGRSVAGQRAGMSHTAAAVASDDLVDALFAQAGVVRLDTVEELVGAARVLTSQPVPTGPRLGVIGNSGGPEILAADTAEASRLADSSSGLLVPELSDRTKQRILATVPGAASVLNPVDLGAGMTAADLRSAIAILLESDEVDAVAIVVTETPVIHRPDVQRIAAELHVDRPVVVSALGGLDAQLDPDLPAPFDFAESAVKALGYAWRYAHLRDRPRGSILRPDGIDVVAAAAHIERHETEGWLDPEHTRALLGTYGISLLPQRMIDSVEDAVAAADELGYPVALKITGPVHKSDVGGVRLDLRNESEVATAYDALRNIADRVLVQKMALPGVELIVGGMQHPQFGPVVMVGAGGVLSDVIADRSLRLAPASDVDIEHMLAQLRYRRLLDGFRGNPPVSRTVLVELVSRVSALLVDQPHLLELDLNPVTCRGTQLAIVDAKVRLGPAQDREPDPLARRMSEAVALPTGSASPLADAVAKGEDEVPTHHGTFGPEPAAARQASS